MNGIQQTSIDTHQRLEKIKKSTFPNELCFIKSVITELNFFNFFLL